MHDRDGNNMLDGTELIAMLLQDTSPEEYDEEVLRYVLALLGLLKTAASPCACPVCVRNSTSVSVGWVADE